MTRPKSNHAPRKAASKHGTKSKMPSQGLAIRQTFFIGVLMIMTTVLTNAKSNHDGQSAFINDLRRVPIVTPKTAPAVNQDSIDLAMAMYNIDIPADVDRPIFDHELSDRGTTSKLPHAKNLSVKIGSAAFENWSLLGSTLAHEVEVHCQQNFFMIYLLDQLNLDGTNIAERAAYDHELKKAGFFGLNAVDKMSIAETRDFYYPTHNHSLGFSVSDTKKLASWNLFSAIGKLFKDRFSANPLSKVGTVQMKNSKKKAG